MNSNDDFRTVLLKLADHLRDKAGPTNPSYWSEYDAAPWQLASTAREAAKFEAYHEIADIIDDIVALKALTNDNT